MYCKKCGGEMIGDGFKSLIRCENYEGEDCAPDAGPIYCNPDIKMTPSQQAKQAGLESLAELSRLTGEAQRNLINWHEDKPRRFAIMCEWAANAKL
jgi:hypothetical protein